MKPTQFYDVWGITPDVNGNPRYVISFLSIAPTMKEAMKKTKAIAGSKYRGKEIGGGIVFSTYNLEKTLEIIGYRPESPMDEIKALARKCSPEEIKELTNFFNSKMS